MIPNKQKIKHRISGATKVHKARIKEGMDVIISIVVDIYSRPERAVIRELVSNAIDEHIKYDVERPIELKVPTTNSLKFSVRDYGRGLSNDRILELFPTIGQSTKQDSDDFIGSFGIGRFSAFTCTDSAIIISYYEGVKTSYAWSRSSDGGVILSDPMFSGPTDEPSGLKIEFSVKKDTNNFERNLDVLSYVETPITCNVNIPKPPEVKLKGSNWAILKNIYADSNCVMGQIKYPLQLPSKLSHLYYMSLDVPIGSVDLTNNREALRYTERTKTELNKQADIVLKELKDYALGEVNKQPTALQKLEKAKDLEDYVTLKEVEHDGKTYQFVVAVDAHKRKTSRRDGSVVFSQRAPITSFQRIPQKKNIVVDNLGKLSDKCIRHKFIGLERDVIYIFDSVEDAKRTTLIEDTSQFLIVSEYIQSIPKTVKTTQSRPKNDFDSAEVFEYTGDGDHYHYSYIKEYLKPVTLKHTDSFYYSGIFRYKSNEIRLYRELQKHTKDLPKVYFVKKAAVYKYPNAINIADFLQKKRSEVIEREKKFRTEYLVATSEEFKLTLDLVKNGYLNKDTHNFVNTYKDFHKYDFYENVGYTERNKFQSKNPTLKLPLFQNSLIKYVLDNSDTNNILKELAHYLNYKETKENART